MPESVILPSFSKGEVSPAVYGRVDHGLYYSALRRARNVTIQPYGGASNRNGTRYIGPIKNHAEGARLIPFKYKANDHYMLELGHGYMRVIRGSGHVLDRQLQIKNIVFGDPIVVETEVDHGLEAGDDIYIHGLNDLHRLNVQWYHVGAKTDRTINLAHQSDDTNFSGTTDRMGTLLVYEQTINGGFVSKIYEVASPFDYEALANVKFVQSSNEITFTHVDYDSYSLRRITDDNWEFKQISFNPEQDFPRSLEAEVADSGDEDDQVEGVKYVVTAVNSETGEESLPGLAKIGYTISAISKGEITRITLAEEKVELP